jgi:hypothetical protein
MTMSNENNSPEFKKPSRVKVKLKIIKLVSLGADPRVVVYAPERYNTESDEKINHTTMLTFPDKSLKDLG